MNDLLLQGAGIVFAVYVANGMGGANGRAVGGSTLRDRFVARRLDTQLVNSFPYHREVERREADRIHEAIAAGVSDATMRRTLIDSADRVHAQYPQYQGYYDAWKLGQVTRQIRTKGGIRFEAGDPTIYMRRKTYSRDEITAYSWRSGTNVVIESYDLEPRTAPRHRAAGGATGGRATVQLSAQGARILRMLAPYPWESSGPDFEGNRVTFDREQAKLLLIQSGPGVGFPRGDATRIRAGAAKLGLHPDDRGRYHYATGGAVGKYERIAREAAQTSDPGLARHYAQMLALVGGNLDRYAAIVASATRATKAQRQAMESVYVAAMLEQPAARRRSSGGDFLRPGNDSRMERLMGGRS